MTHCICGALLPPAHAGGGRQKQYCSDRCRQQAKRDRDSAKRDTLPLLMLNQITTGDSRELAKVIPDASIDLIFCDPPYLKKNIEDGVYEWLAEEAARVLKPGALCFAYTCALWLPDVLEQMSKHLTYHWTYLYVHKGQTGVLHSSQTIVRYTPVVCFSQGKAAKHAYLLDVLMDSNTGGKDKRFHKWGQNEDMPSYFIERLTAEGHVVFDPFTGGGTVPSVCKQLGRDFIAFELEPATAAIARKRLEIVQPFLIPKRAIQAELEVSA
jgi:DNA methylase